jgi:ATP-dependent helicase/nuclease subunit A
MPASLQAITAAAGAGKTTRIVRDIAAEVASRPPEEILATTFTIKAADELLERARAELFRQGEPEAAARLLGARFGTVNAVCGQIVSEFALDLGRSPSTAVIGDANESLAFSIAADSAISAHAPTLNRLADLFGFNDPRPPGTDAPDWRRTVRSILTLARANGLVPGDLAESAKRSMTSYGQLWPPIASAGDALDRELADALAAAVAARPTAPSATALKDLPTLRSAQQRASRGERLPWSLWSRLTKVGCAPTKDGRAYQAALVQVIAAAGRHAGHPTLRQETELFIRTVFTCAADGLSAYQSWKAERGLVDFTDQEVLALQVLSNPDLAERLRERVGRVFVDEFQDSSPLQVALFARLAELAEASTWVGDPKQAIYSFRGADTELTQSAFAGAGASSQDVLSTSWRSRPSLVAFANAMFSDPFERMGLAAAQHAFSGAARSDVGFTRHPLAWWQLAGKASEQAEALAVGVRDALQSGDSWIVEGANGEHRPLAAGDIAVLCRSNIDVGRFATALSRAGLPVAVERSGLARTPHVELVLAACRWLADPGDRLAMAEMARFFADDPESGAWLEAAADDHPDIALQALVPPAESLGALRGQVLNLTPAELLDAVLALPQIIGRIEAWGDHPIRLDDLEALRGFAAAYEAECAASGAPATLQGFLLALNEAKPKRPPSLAADAIQVMTFHGAKGLEWPMTILTGMAWEPRARLYEPVAEVEGRLDWSRPLEGRWIRLWPWPYGLSGSGSALDVAAAASPFGQAALRRAIQEDTRLLYVGVTRARDYLVFAPAAKAPLNWLKVLDGPGGEAHIQPPASDDNLVWAGSESFAADVRILQADDSPPERYPNPAYVTAASGGPQSSAVPLFLRPSAAVGEGWAVAERISLGTRLPIDGVADMAALGEALHVILGYDDPTRDRGTRLADAQATLDRWRVRGFAAADALTASERLHAALADRFPEGVLRREAPVTAKLGEQLVQGRIDLLVENGEGGAIVDHKSFPGRMEHWEAKAIEHAPQVALYAEAVKAASGRSCDDLFVHMPVVGALLRVTRA